MTPTFTSMQSSAPVQQHVYKQYPQRWLMVAICFWINVVVQIIFIGFATISIMSFEYYRLPDVSGINWLALVWCGLFPPFAFAAAWMFDKYGLRKGLIVSGAVLAFASLIRCFSLITSVRDGQKTNVGAYVAVLLGSVIASTAQPAIMASTTLLATSWFNEHQRNLANGLLTMATPIGFAAGSVLSPLVVPSADPHMIDTLLLVHAAFAVSAFLLCFLLHDHPPTPPCATAHRPAIAERFTADLKSLGGNLPFIALCNVFSLALGAPQALLTVMQQMLAPQGYTPDDAGMVSAIMVIAGIFGAGISGPVLDRTREYKKMMAVCLTLTLPCAVLFVIISHRANMLAALCIISGLLGFFSFPLLPTCLDASVEVAYPVSAGLTTGVLWSGAQVTTLLLVLLIDGPLSVSVDGTDPPIYNLEPGMWLIVSCLAAAAVLSWLWTGKYVRREAEVTAHVEMHGINGINGIKEPLSPQTKDLPLDAA